MKKITIIILALLCMQCNVAAAKEKRTIYAVNFPEGILLQQYDPSRGFCLAASSPKKIYESDSLDLTVVEFVSCDSLPLSVCKESKSKIQQVFGAQKLEFKIALTNGKHSVNTYYSWFLVGPETDSSTDENFIAYPMDDQWIGIILVALMEKAHPEVKDSYKKGMVTFEINGKSVLNVNMPKFVTELEAGIKQFDK